MTPRRLPAVIGFLVLLLGAAVVLAVGMVPGHVRVPERVSVPRELPGYSYLTTDSAHHPLGRATVLYRQGFGVESGDIPQVLALGSDGRTVRTVDVAVRRGPSQGDPAPMSLSPDGSRVALGVWQTPRASAADLALVDLATGATRVLALPDAPGVVPLAWSRDSRYLAYVTAGTAGPFEPSVLGPLVVLDTATGRTRSVAEDVSAAAFSPDGSRIAVQSRSTSQVRVLDRSGGVLELLSAPAGTTLAGGDAWSPDGSLLAVRDDAAQEVEFLPARGGAPVPAPVRAGGRVLGWLSATELLVPQAAGADHAGDYRLVRADLSTGTTRTWTSVPTAHGNYAVSDVSLATALLPEAHVVAPAGVDRGPWPVGLRLGLVLAGAVLASFATTGLQRRVTSVRAAVRDPDWAADSFLG
jgi:dipeptidyl aminopeptidase/acylaminoacyl peptidase